MSQILTLLKSYLSITGFEIPSAVGNLYLETLWVTSGMPKLEKSSLNHHSNDSDVPMFLRRKRNEIKKQKTCRTCTFKAFQQLEKVEIIVRYTLYINMLTFVSLVVFWRHFLSMNIWFIKVLFYRFLNLNLAMFLTCFLLFFHLEPYVS